MLNNDKLIITPLDYNIQFTSSTSFAFTGKTISVPAKTYICAQADFKYNHAQPVKASVGYTSELAKDLSTSVTGQYSCTVNFSFYNSSDSPHTLYLNAQYNAANTNNVYIRGFTIKVNNA